MVNASETTRIALYRDSAAMGELVDSIEAVVKNVSAVMEITDKKQRTSKPSNPRHFEVGWIGLIRS